MMRTTAIALLFGSLIGAATAPVAAADVCTCRAPGKRVELGGTACLQTPKGPRLARCVVDVNIMSWQITDTPCVVSDRADPAPRSRFADLPGTSMAVVIPSERRAVSLVSSAE